MLQRPHCAMPQNIRSVVDLSKQAPPYYRYLPALVNFNFQPRDARSPAADGSLHPHQRVLRWIIGLGYASPLPLTRMLPVISPASVWSPMSMSFPSPTRPVCRRLFTCSPTGLPCNGNSSSMSSSIVSSSVLSFIAPAQVDVSPASPTSSPFLRLPPKRRRFLGRKFATTFSPCPEPRSRPSPVSTPAPRTATPPPSSLSSTSSPSVITEGSETSGSGTPTLDRILGQLNEAVRPQELSDSDHGTIYSTEPDEELTLYTNSDVSGITWDSQNASHITDLGPPPSPCYRFYFDPSAPSPHTPVYAEPSYYSGSDASLGCYANQEQSPSEFSVGNGSLYDPFIDTLDSIVWSEPSVAPVRSVPFVGSDCTDPFVDAASLEPYDSLTDLAFLLEPTSQLSAGSPFYERPSCVPGFRVVTSPADYSSSLDSFVGAMPEEETSSMSSSFADIAPALDTSSASSDAKLGGLADSSTNIDFILEPIDQIVDDNSVDSDHWADIAFLMDSDTDSDAESIADSEFDMEYSVNPAWDSRATQLLGSARSVAPPTPVRSVVGNVECSVRHSTFVDDSAAYDADISNNLLPEPEESFSDVSSEIEPLSLHYKATPDTYTRSFQPRATPSSAPSPSTSAWSNIFTRQSLVTIGASVIAIALCAWSF